jgi:hypothetical protein
VWLSNAPLDGNEGAVGDTILIVQFRVPLRRLSDYEVIEEGKGYREWVMPAAFIAGHATITVFPASLSRVAEIRQKLPLFRWRRRR